MKRTVTREQIEELRERISRKRKRHETASDDKARLRELITAALRQDVRRMKQTRKAS